LVPYIDQVLTLSLTQTTTKERAVQQR